MGGCSRLLRNSLLMPASITTRRLRRYRKPGFQTARYPNGQAVQDATQSVASAALARGNITVVRDDVEGLLSTFQINLDRTSAAYRKLGMAVLAAEVRGWKAIERRNVGEPIETPQSSDALL